MNIHPQEIRFEWPECSARLRDLLASTPLYSDERGRRLISQPFDDPEVTFTPPLLLPLDGLDPNAFVEKCERGPGRQLVILMQAGATAMGIWEDDRLVAHKVIKKYVTRGRGKAQTTYLKTRGKSRYGSRLRLQNAKDHLIETNEKLHAWWNELGAFDLILYSCPVRMWPEVFKAKPAPPFDKDAAIIKIPRDVRVPGHEELLRVRRFAAMGAITYRSPEEEG